MTAELIDRMIDEWYFHTDDNAKEKLRKFGAALLSASKTTAVQDDEGEPTREVIEPLKEPVSIAKALLGGRLAKIGGNEKETTAFLVNIQLAPWGAPKEWVEGFVDGFNRAAKWMQSALTEFHAKPVEEPTTNALNALKRARDGWQEESASLAKRLTYMEADNDLLRKHQSKDVWYFQGDGEDHIESMGNNMVVVIHAHDLRSLMAPAQEQCGCRISFAQINAAGDLERVTIHYGKGRVAYVVLPAQSGVELARELLDTLQATVKHFTKMPSSLVDSQVRGRAHEVIAKAYAQIGRGGPAIAAPTPSAEEAPRLVGYGDCKCVLTQYCDGKCRPIFEKAAAPQPDDSCPRCKLPLTRDCNCDAAYVARAALPQATAMSGRLIEAARQVEEWWITEGKNHFNGAPVGMFNLRDALSAVPRAAAFEWPPLPELPKQSFYAFDRALFTDHQMQGYANAYGEAVRAAMAKAKQRAQTSRTLTDAEIIALNEGEVFFSETPTKFPRAGHGTQYHCGAPGLIKFARALIALASTEQPETGGVHE